MSVPVGMRIKDGVEFYDVGGGDEDAQCARCGSSVLFDYVEETVDGSFGAAAVWSCLSSPEWCEAHPLPGRENQKGAGRP